MVSSKLLDYNLDSPATYLSPQAYTFSNFKSKKSWDKRRANNVDNSEKLNKNKTVIWVNYYNKYKITNLFMEQCKLEGSDDKEDGEMRTRI